MQPDYSASPTFRTPTWVSDLLEVTTKTLANWRSAGSGPPFVKAGGRVLYKESDVYAWLDSRRASSTTEFQHRQLEAERSERANRAIALKNTGEKR
jgi:Predicted site-specific integrase-resolvase